MVQAKAPNGYDLLKEAVPVFVHLTSASVSVYIVDTHGVRLPETGGQGTAGKRRLVR